MRTVALWIAMILVAVPAIAVPVDPDAADEVAALYGYNGTAIVLRTTGQVYRYDYDAQVWVRHEYLDVPVPVSQIADWQLTVVITTSGDWWYRNPGAGGTWEQIARPDWVPIASEGQSLGGIKALFRK